MMYTTWMRYDLGDEGREGLGCFGEGGREGVRERGKLRHTERGRGRGRESLFFQDGHNVYTAPG